MLSDGTSEYSAGTGSKLEPDHWRKITDDNGIHPHVYTLLTLSHASFLGLISLGARAARMSRSDANLDVFFPRSRVCRRTETATSSTRRKRG